MNGKSLRYLCFQDYQNFVLDDSVEVIPINNDFMYVCLDYYLGLFGEVSQNKIYRINELEILLNLRDENQYDDENVYELTGFDGKDEVNWSISPTVEDRDGSIIHVSTNDGYKMIHYNGNLKKRRHFIVQFLGFYFKNMFEYFDEDVLGVGTIRKEVYKKVNGKLN